MTSQAGAPLGGLSLAEPGFGSAQAAYGGMGGGGDLVDHAGPIGHGPMDRFAYGYRDNDCYCLLRWAESTGSRYWWSQYRTLPIVAPRRPLCERSGVPVTRTFEPPPSRGRCLKRGHLWDFPKMATYLDGHLSGDDVILAAPKTTAQIHLGKA